MMREPSAARENVKVPAAVHVAVVRDVTAVAEVVIATEMVEDLQPEKVQEKVVEKEGLRADTTAVKQPKLAKVVVTKAGQERDLAVIN